MAHNIYPQTLDGMKDDIRQYMRAYGTAESDDMLTDFKVGWPGLMRLFFSPAMIALVEEGFLTVVDNGRGGFTAILTAPPLQ